MSSVPVSVPSLPTLVDDQDDVLAADQNTPNDEIEAIAALMGMLGKAQSYSLDFLDALVNRVPPIVTKATSTSFSVSAGAVACQNSGGSFRLLRRNTSSTTVTASDIDTGTMAVGMYYIFAVADAAATTFTVKFSLSSTAPTGLTSFELIGWFYNETISVMDLTYAYIGNVKSRGRDVPNSVTRVTSTDSSSASSSMADCPETTIQFYSTGRPVLLLFDAITTGSANNIGAKCIFNIDSADISNSDMREISANVATADTADSRANVSGYYLHTSLSAGAHTLKIRFLAPTGTTHVYQRRTSFIEI